MMEDVGMQDVHFNEVSALASVGLLGHGVSQGRPCSAHEGFLWAAAGCTLRSDQNNPPDG